MLATAAVTVGSLAGCGGEPFRPERDLGVASPTIASPPPTQSARPTSGPSSTPTTGSPTVTTSTGPSLPSLPTAQERPGASASTASPANPTPGSTATAPAPAPGPTSTSPRPGTAAPTATPTPTSTPRPTVTRTTRPTGEPSRPSSPTRTQRPPSPTSTTARPTTPPPTTSSPTSSTPPAAPAYLDELGGPGSGPVTMGGTTYGHSISASACTIFSKQPTYAWSLDGRYSRLTGVVGQDDGSESREAVLRLVVRGDGRTLASRTVRYGQTSSLGVSVAGVQRLTVSFTEVECAPGEGAALVLGSGKVG
ncbi:NPCBM/NEW2 domain-containing protein [Barrientosiimonas humi]|uniref:NPCBM/NEW2 domain-containing protein n=1 Tax=Barrientosiimonas humi TaxID=999931 RepID=UPI00370DC3E3